MQEDYAEDVEQPYKELPIPSKLCARKSIMELTAHLNAEPVSSFDDLDDLDPAATVANVRASSEETQANTTASDATEPTKVTMNCSLGVLSMLASKGTLENLENRREVVAMAVENFRSTVRGKDNAILMLRKNMGYAVAETDKTYLYQGESHELNLTQQDEVKSVFPIHLAIVESGTGQMLVDQTFHMPKSVEINYLSVNAFRRYGKIVRHYRTAATRGLWSKAVGEPVPSLVDGNRPRKATKDDDADISDHHLTRYMKIFEPLMVASGDRSSDCINRYHKNLPCY